jgi:hypothetical protein
MPELWGRETERETSAGGGGRPGLTAPRKDKGGFDTDSRITCTTSEVKAGEEVVEGGVTEDELKVKGGMSIR